MKTFCLIVSILLLESISRNLKARYQFTGREKDDVTVLYYYRARQYDSKLGRFISEDPIGFAGGDVNLYGYAGNNPMNSFVPLGLYVVIFLDVKSGHMRAWDVRNGEKYVDAIRRKPDWEYEGVFSGGGNRNSNNTCKNNPSCELIKNVGPTPRGWYVVDGSTNTAGSGWRQYSFRLYRQLKGNMLETQPPTALYSHSDEPIGNSGVSRGGYYLHPGTISEGCVTIPTEDRKIYDELRAIIENTSKMSFFSRTNRFMNGFRKGSGFLYVY